MKTLIALMILAAGNAWADGLLEYKEKHATCYLFFEKSSFTNSPNVAALSCVKDK